jgi:hypothetical protein
MPTPPRTSDPALRISAEALTPEERVRFQSVYDQLAGEYFNGRLPGTRQKLEFTRHLQQSWRRGWTAVGKTYKQINLTVPRRVTPATLAAGAGAPRDRGALLPLGLIGLALLAFGWWTVFGAATLHSQTLPLPATVAATSTSGTAPPTAPPPTVGVGGISIGTQTTPTVLSPTTLKLAGRSFVVTPSGVDNNKNWIVRPDPLYANWLAGSLVNLTFFLALESDPGAAAFVAQLRTASDAPADLTISTNTGVITTRRFQIDQIRTIARTDTDVYNSTALGLTILVRYDQSDARLYLHGREMLLPAATPSATPILTPSAGPSRATATPMRTPAGDHPTPGTLEPVTLPTR